MEEEARVENDFSEIKWAMVDEMREVLWFEGWRREDWEIFELKLENSLNERNIPWKIIKINKNYELA